MAIADIQRKIVDPFRPERMPGDVVIILRPGTNRTGSLRHYDTRNHYVGIIEHTSAQYRLSEARRSRALIQTRPVLLDPQSPTFPKFVGLRAALRIPDSS